MKIGADPVKNGHEIVGNDAGAVLHFAEIVDGGLVVLNKLSGGRRTGFDVLVNRQTFNHAPCKPGILNDATAFADRVLGPYNSRGKGMQRVHDTRCASLADVCKRNRIFRSIPPECFFKEHIVFLPVEFFKFP